MRSQEKGSLVDRYSFDRDCLENGIYKSQRYVSVNLNINSMEAF